MRTYRHASYVECWNALEEVASAPYPVVVWDIRTGALLAASSSAAQTLSCHENISACSFTCEMTVSELFQQLRCRDCLHTRVFYFGPRKSGVARQVWLYYPISPETQLPVNVNIVPVLLDETPEAVTFMREIAIRLSRPEPPHSVMIEGEELTEEWANRILNDYHGMVYIKDLQGRMLGCSSAFMDYLQHSKQEERHGLDISKENTPHMRPVSHELDQRALECAESVAFMGPNRRSYEIVHVWRRIVRIPVLTTAGKPLGLLIVLWVLQDVDLLRAEQERMRKLFDILHSYSHDLPYLLFVWRDNGMHYIDYVSKSVLNIGVSTYELVELPDWADLVHPDDRQIFWDSRVTLSSAPGVVRYRMALPDNRVVPVRETVTQVGSDSYFNWNISRVQVGEGDIPLETPEDERIALFHQIEQRQAYIIQMQIDFNRRTDMRETITDTLSQMCVLFGIEVALLFEERDGVVGLASSYEAPSVMPHEPWPKPGRRALEEVASIKRNYNVLLLREDDEIPEFCAELKRVTGMRNLHLVTVHDEDGPFGLLCYLENTSQNNWRQRDHSDLLQFTQMLSGFVCRNRDRDKLVSLAYRDLTLDVPNNVALNADLDGRLQSGGGGYIALIGLQNLATVENAYGVRYGQAFLRSVRDAAFKIFPRGSIYRVSHTQLAVFVPHWSSTRLSEAMGALFSRFSEPWQALEKQVFGLVAAGATGLTVDCDANEAIRRAGVALAMSEHLEIHFYTESCKPVLQQMELLADLHQEASDNFPHMAVYYQPIFSLEHQAFTSVEALVRWEHPVLGLLSPIRFIELAEQSGLIVPLTECVLSTACKQLRRWRQEGLMDLSVSVNISQRFIREKGLKERILSVIEENHLPPETVILELTESMAIQNTSAVNALLHELRGAGVRVAFDDFGVGFSSLSMLKVIPLDIIKLDKDFIANINSFDELIIKFSVNAARLRGMTVCAEGVETVEQWKKVQSLGVGFLQGYLMHKPSPVDVITPMLHSPESFLREKGL